MDHSNYIVHIFDSVNHIILYTKNRMAAKFSLGIANLFIGIGFFARYGTEPIQKYFALPLYLSCGILFLYESWHNKDDMIKKPDTSDIFIALSGLSFGFYTFRQLFSANGNTHYALSRNQFKYSRLCGLQKKK